MIVRAAKSLLPVDFDYSVYENFKYTEEKTDEDDNSDDNSFDFDIPWFDGAVEI